MTDMKQLYRSFLFGVLALVLVSGVLRTVTARPDPTAPTGKTPTTRVQVPEGKEVATFAAGCFWSMEAMFKQLRGVEKVEPGYAGGQVENPGYEQVGQGNTGHAETVSILFDPQEISYRDLLRVLMTVHDPTTLNRQGPDEGPQYRSAIFFHNPQQQKAAREVIQEVTKAGLWQGKIVTEVTPFTNFYRAEEYHLDYYNRHPDEPYCKSVIAPKIEKFQTKFKSRLKP